MVEELSYYELGNCLRGYFSGMYPDDATAWDALSEKFNKAFPSRSGRDVALKKTILRGNTAGGNETDADKRLRERVEAMREVDRAEEERLRPFSESMDRYNTRERN